MKNIKNYQDLTFYTIEENLRIAKYCLETPKKANTNSCYGMSALILLASTIDAIGMFYRNGDNTFAPIEVKHVKSKQLGSVKGHFEFFYDKFLSNNCDKNSFTVQFYQYARCLGIHNGTLNPSIRITMNRHKNGKVIEQSRVNYHIYLIDLFDNVQLAFQTLKRESKVTIEPEVLGPTTGGC
jgi:hypothetical protein